MKAASLAAFVVLGACSHTAENPIVAAKNCLAQHVSPNTKVSALKARAAVEDCKAQLDKWSRREIEGQFKKPLDATDAKMMAAYREHRAVLQDFWLVRMSNEITPTFYRM